MIMPDVYTVETDRNERHVSRSHPIVALIPAYNESRFIGSLVIACRPYVDLVVVIDDGSRDKTAAIARQAGATVVRLNVNQGKAMAVNIGFSYVRQLQPRAVVMLDGDGQHSAEDIPQVLAPIIADQADVVIGSRFKEVKSDIPAYRQIGQHGLTITTNLASGVWVSDSQSGFRAFSAVSLEQLSFSQGGFSLESEMQFLARQHKFRIVEAPITVVYAEKAKRNPFTHGMQVINGVMRLMGQTRPLLFFSGSGLFISLAGLLLGVYVADMYNLTHVLAIGHALIVVLLCIVGVVLFFSGSILHSMRGMMLDLRRSIHEVIQHDRTIVAKHGDILEPTNGELLERSVGQDLVSR